MLHRKMETKITVEVVFSEEDLSYHVTVNGEEIPFVKRFRMSVRNDRKDDVHDVPTITVEQNVML